MCKQNQRFLWSSTSDRQHHIFGCVHLYAALNNCMHICFAHSFACLSDYNLSSQPSVSIMTPDEIKDMMESLHCTASDMDKEDLSMLHRACSVIERISSEQCRKLISDAGHRPCLQVFQSDGWSCDIRSRFRFESQGAQVPRIGRLRTEFVCQRSMVKALINGEMKLAMRFERPRPLATKKCMDVWVAACESCPMLKLAKHPGISITFYIQDGLFSKPFGRRMQAKHSLFFDPIHSPIRNAAERSVSELRDWVLCGCCIAHSCSRALKWGLKSMVSGEAFLEDTHVTISSLLRASTGLHLSVAEFVVGFVSYDRDDPEDLPELEQFWSFLDVEPSMLGLVVNVNPLWDGRRLRVSSALADAPDGVQRVTTVIHYMMRWVDFSETRWCKVGQSGRLYLRSLLIGIDQIVRITVRNDAISKWHLGGYQRRSTTEVRTYLCVAACAGRPSESLLLQLMEDDRFLLHHESLWQFVTDEFQYLLALPSNFYSTVADVLQVPTDQFWTQVIDASVVSMAYLHMDMWVPLSHAPFKYFVGNASAKIEALKNEVIVTDVLSAKMQALCVAGYETEVESAIHLVRECSFTSILVEQAHASGAQLMHRHPQLETAALVSRMTVHNTRTLFYPSHFEKQELRLNALLEQVVKQMENTKFTQARQAYVKLLVDKCKAGSVQRDPSDHSIRRAIFKRHSEHFSQLLPGQLSVLRSKASAMVKKKIEGLAESKEHVQGQLRLLRERQVESKALGIVNHIDSIRYGDAEFSKILRTFLRV